MVDHMDDGGRFGELLDAIHKVLERQLLPKNRFSAASVSCATRRRQRLSWPSRSGLKACEQGLRVLFTTAAGLIALLGKAFAEGRIDERLKLLAQPQLLKIDEIGHIPIDQGAWECHHRHRHPRSPAASLTVNIRGDSDRVVRKK